MESIEEWRDIIEFEVYYQASNMGRIRSLDRQVKSRWGDDILKSLKGKIMTQTLQIHPISGAQYYHVGLRRDGKFFGRSSQNWILRAFVGLPPLYGNPPREMEACHVNNKSLDNRPSNLYWGTHSQNIQQTLIDQTNYSLSKTHCPQNHQYDENNTYIITTKKSVARGCKICRKVSARKHYEKKRMSR